MPGTTFRREDGVAMAALLVAMSVMAVALSVALPSWKTIAPREREEELVFRGTQYARPVAHDQRKYANAFPPNVDLLVEQRFLRRKYKDPMTKDGEFLRTKVQENTTDTEKGKRLGQQMLSGEIVDRRHQLSMHEVTAGAQNHRGARVDALSRARHPKCFAWDSFDVRIRHAFFTAWPPNSLRRAAITVAPNESV